MDGVAAQVWMASLGGERAGQAAGFCVLWPTSVIGKLWLHVAPEFRLQGVGRTLLEALERSPFITGIQSLRLTEALDEFSSPWFERHGFSAWNELNEFSFRINESDRLLRRLWDRVKKTIPPSAEMITLAEADQRGFSAFIAKLQALAVGGFPSMLLQKIAHAKASGDDQSISLDNSLIIVLNGQLLAFALNRFDPHQACWFIDGMYVAPEFRDGWATIWMRYELVQTGLRLGRTNECRVQARNDQTNTLRFARRLGAKRVSTKRLLEKKLINQFHC